MNSLMELDRTWPLLMLFQNVTEEYHTYEFIKPVADIVIKFLSFKSDGGLSQYNSKELHSFVIL